MSDKEYEAFNFKPLYCIILLKMLNGQNNFRRTRNKRFYDLGTRVYIKVPHRSATTFLFLLPTSWWWFMTWSNCILTERAGFKSLDGIRLFWFRIAVNLFILGIGLFLSMCYKMVHSLCYSFLCPIIIYHKFTNCNLTTYQEKGIIQSKERPGKAHIEKNVPTLYFLP